MLEIDKTIWIGLARGVESVSGAGAAVWREPAAARKALGELLGVLPVTYGEFDAGAIIGARDADRAAGWRALLEGKSEAAMSEMALAINDAFRAPKTWGVALPCPGALAALLGDGSERAALKIGMQMAARLKLFRDAGASFLTMDLANSKFAAEERALKPVLRNAELYGWKRALCVPALADTAGLESVGDALLVLDAEVGELDARWQQGLALGGGLGEQIWSGRPLAPRQSANFLLFGRIPAGAPAHAIVDAARMISVWAA